MIGTDFQLRVWDALLRIPMGRAGESREVADAVVFLASPSSSYVTGQSLVLDGGATAAGPFASSAGEH